MCKWIDMDCMRLLLLFLLFFFLSKKWCWSKICSFGVPFRFYWFFQDKHYIKERNLKSKIQFYINESRRNESECWLRNTVQCTFVCQSICYEDNLLDYTLICNLLSLSGMNYSFSNNVHTHTHAHSKQT